MNEIIKNTLFQARQAQKKRKHSTKPCPDQCIGKIDYTTQTGTFAFTGKVKTKYSTGLDRKNIDDSFVDHSANSIVLVLESPHTQEYDEYKKPIGPAYGKTGYNINEYLEDILNEALSRNIIVRPLKSASYDLIVMNAIQYQTSLGVSTCIYRDAMFLRCWEDVNFRKSFYKRLRNIMDKQTSCIVINCCTRGQHLDLLTTHSGSLGSSKSKDKSYFDELGIDYQNWNLEEYTLKECVKRIMFKVKRHRSTGMQWLHISHPSSWSRNSANRELRKY